MTVRLVDYAEFPRGTDPVSSSGGVMGRTVGHVTGTVEHVSDVGARCRRQSASAGRRLSTAADTPILVPGIPQLRYVLTSCSPQSHPPPHTQREDADNAV